MIEPEYVRTTLQQLLASREGELGARLKQRLNALLLERSLPRFDEKQFGFRKFRSFLEQTQSDWLDVSLPDGTGDILVTAKVARATLPPPGNRTLSSTSQPIRSDVWQAFTNPDTRRKRHYQLSTGIVLHYAEGENSPKREQVEAAQDGYVEIHPIDGETQQRWVREFLDSVPITGTERVPYEALLAGPYSSALNAAFTRALGEHATAWRDFRTARVTDAILIWAQNHNVPPEHLRTAPKENRAILGPHMQQTAPASRVQAMKLLELLSDEDIRQIIIPTLLSTIMVKSRI